MYSIIIVLQQINFEFEEAKVGWSRYIEKNASKLKFYIGKNQWFFFF
jgi:hypothetical protein